MVIEKGVDDGPANEPVDDLWDYDEEVEDSHLVDGERIDQQGVRHG